MYKKAYDFLGLAQRAGKISSGEAAAEAIIKKGKAKLVLLAIDASDNTVDYFTRLAKLHKVPLIKGGEKPLLGLALGKSPRSVVVVIEKGFASKLSTLFGGEETDF